MKPLEGLVDAEDVEEAFRVSYVDFQQDFMEELKQLFFTNFEKQLSQIMSDIASIKQQQARLSVTSNIIDSLRKGDIQSTDPNNQTSKNVKNIESMVSQLLSENKVLKDQLARVTSFLEMNTHDKPKTHRQLFSPSSDQSFQKLNSFTDAQTFDRTSFCSNDQDMLDQSKSHPQVSAPLISSPDAQEHSPVPENSNIFLKPTPIIRKWADVCDSSISTPPTKGWAIAAASVSFKKPESPSCFKKKESLNIVLSGDIPCGSLSSMKEELILRFNTAISPSLRGLERDFCSSDITNILIGDNKSIVVRLCSLEVKSIIMENRKLLSSCQSSPFEEPSTFNQSPHTWKMFVSPHLDYQDLKNQKIVLKAFQSQQAKDNGSPSFKAFAQGYSIKIVTAEGAKFFYPFDCKQSPHQFLLSKGIKCKKQ